MSSLPGPRWGTSGPRLTRSARREVSRRLGPLAPPPGAGSRLGPVVPPSRLPAAARTALAGIVGADRCVLDGPARFDHAGGWSYLDLIARRGGGPIALPDAVVHPGDPDQVAAVLAVCAEHGVAVVPYGGGTSVVGGVSATRGPFPAVVALDLDRLDRIDPVDEESRTVTVQAGVRAVAVERALGRSGFTLGHLPQSFERASVGGFVATRSAGQASTGYGAIADLVESVRLATPVGQLLAGRAPASAAGPDLRALVVGSEGIFGVITEVTLRVRPRPAVLRDEGWVFPDFAAGVAALRELAQNRVAPEIVRLSDPAETALGLALAGGVAQRLVGPLLRARGGPHPCLLITGYEGRPEWVRFRRRATRRVLRGHGGRPVGRRIGHAWRAGRFAAPYLRDELLDRGVLAETLETAASWSDLLAVHDEVGGALAGALAGDGHPALVGAHVSHLYETGASVYFTGLARAVRGGEAEQWARAKAAASAAIVRRGATITHHHGVGTEHAGYLSAEIGTLGVAVLRAVKATLDPVGILNPGKLLPPA